tara:strand:- start:1737 stop:3131 length:1395 start_codon:yes stop_codon:yes gene_type:complete
MHKRTKIISTIGPSSKSITLLKQLYSKGMNVVRINMSHTSTSNMKKIVNDIHSLNKTITSSIGIMIDTQGPEIRTANFGKDIKLTKGEEIFLVSNQSKKKNQIAVDNLVHVKGLKSGGKISLDNGQIDLKILSISKHEIKCLVLDSGQISEKKHVNFPGAKIKLPTLTEKDKLDLLEALKVKVDFIALSFCRSSKDLKDLNNFLKGKKSQPQVFAKIEDQEGIKNIREITKNSDGLMIARGDLGIETDMTNLPYVQRNMVKIASELGKKSIVATQLLESMINKPHPTRAEVSDVTNAVYEGADALMLSAETSIGKHPVRCVQYLRDISLNAERSETLHFESNLKHESDWHTLAATSVKLAKKINAHAIVVLTRSGFTADLISSARPRVPVFAFTNNKSTQNKLSIASSIENIFLNFKSNHERTIENAFQILKNKYKLRSKNKIIVISGIFSDIFADAIQIRFLK